MQVALFVLGLLVFAGMSIAAHSLAYFPGDVAISHAVQAFQADWLDAAFDAVSWFGFPPQSNVLFGGIVVLLFVSGARWAAVCEALAALGSGGLYFLLEPVIAQPRPSADLVRVVWPIGSTSFPSGHVATFTATLGFLVFLWWVRAGPSKLRWVPFALVAVVLVLIGTARIYAGHHWASDVFAGWLLGALWLFVVVQAYQAMPRLTALMGRSTGRLKTSPGG